LAQVFGSSAQHALSPTVPPLHILKIERSSTPANMAALEASRDLEKQPLLEGRGQNQETFGSIEESTGQITPINDHDEWDCTKYDITVMTTWKAFGIAKGAAWDNGSIWRVMLFSLVLSCAVAFASFQSPQVLMIKRDKIIQLGTFLNVFVGMLLGFFLSSSMTRWHACVNAFMELLDAVRGMQMQMTALGVDHERTEMLSRFGILSAWLLHLSLNSERKALLPEQLLREKMWSGLEQIRPHLINPGEKEMLLQHKECYALLWTWVASLIGRMSENGEIPPMASPTYGRIIEIVEMAYGSIRDVRVMHLVKAPFIYVHTLAILVHVNNILNSISFGIVLGMTSQVILGKDGGKHRHDLPRLLIGLVVQFFISMVAPFLYLALLEVCVCVSQPFTYQDTKIPSLTLIRALEDDIANATAV